MTPASRRRGACPALSAPMETGDGLLVRLTLADGALSPAAFAGLAAAARDFGNGILEVTARGSLQLRGLRAETVGPLNAAVDALCIRAREGLAIDVSPLSGLDVCEIADARPLAEAVRIGVAAFADGLGPKVSVVIDGGGAVSLDKMKADVRLKARPDGGWDVRLAGDAREAVFSGGFEASEAVSATVALLAEVAALGPTARMAEVIETEGIAFPRPMGPPPPQGERVGVGQVKAGGLIPLTDTTFALAVALPFGAADNEIIAALAEAAAEHGARDLRPAPQRMLLAVGLGRENARSLAEKAADLGFIVDASDPRLSVAACPGAPACASGHIPARTLAPQIAETLAPLLDGTFTVHVSGCAKGCAHPAAAALAVVGRDDQGMDFFAGLVRHGTAAAKPEAVLPAPALLPALARLAKEERRPGESGADLLTRLPFEAILEPSS